MAQIIARLETLSSPLASQFGRQWATTLFGEEAIASLPLLKAGKNKGQPKGYVFWRKAISGGWCRECQSPLAVGQLADAWIGIGPCSTREYAVSGQWLGRMQPLGGSKYHLFQEGRDRWAAEQARNNEIRLGEVAEWYAELTPEKKAAFEAKTDPERMARINGYIKKYCS